MQGSESVLASGMLVVEPSTSCQGCDPVEAKFGLSALFFFSGREPGSLLGRIGVGARLSSTGWPQPGQGSGEGRGRFRCRGWRGSLVEQIMARPGLSCAWEQLGLPLLRPGSAAGCGASRWPRCHPTGSRCGRAGLHSPNLLQPDRITMPARWGIMASVCLRYKGTGLSHEVILISYTLIHCSACQPAVGLAADPTRLRRAARTCLLAPRSLLEHQPSLALGVLSPPASSPTGYVQTLSRMPGVGDAVAAMGGVPNPETEEQGVH